MPFVALFGRLDLISYLQTASRFPGPFAVDFDAIFECLFWHLPQAAPRALGVPSLRDRLRRPSARMAQESATGKQRASIHAGTLLADPSPSGGSLRSRCCLFRLISAPKILWGAEMAGLL